MDRTLGKTSMKTHVLAIVPDAPITSLVESVVTIRILEDRKSVLDGLKTIESAVIEICPSAESDYMSDFVMPSSKFEAVTFAHSMPNW